MHGTPAGRRSRLESRRPARASRGRVETARRGCCACRSCAEPGWRDRSTLCQRPFWSQRPPTVTGVRRAGGAVYRLLMVADPDGPDPEPGQFAMLAAAERWGGREDERPYLPRAFSIARRRDGQSRILLEDVALASLLLGAASGWPSELWALGPRERVTPPLAGAPGDPPRRWRGDRAACDSPGRARGRDDGPPRLSRRSAHRGRRAPQRRAGGERRRLGRAPRTRHRSPQQLSSSTTTTRSCTRAAPRCWRPSGRCARRWVSRPSSRSRLRMACGFGACFGCAVPRRGGGYLRVCVDGPAIDAAVLDHVDAHAGAPA